MKVVNLVDPKGRTSIMYGIENSKLERIESESKEMSDKIRRSFYISPNIHKEILVLSIMEDQVFANIAIIEKDVLKLASVSTKIEFIKTEKDKTVELYYNPTSERKIFVIDLESGNEIEPELNFTSTGEMKGIINLETGKKYITIEIRPDQHRSIIVAACNLNLEDNVLKLNINKEEAKRISLVKYLELIHSGKNIEQRLLDTTIEKER